MSKTGGEPIRTCITFLFLLRPLAAAAADRIALLDSAPTGAAVDRSGHADASQALIGAIEAANAITATGGPACVYVPPGSYRILCNPPEFARAGCSRGDGPTQSVIVLDPAFFGDLFTRSEARAPTTPGPTVVGLKLLGSRSAKSRQSALVFCDRNDEAFLDNLVIDDVPGRALYSGMTKHKPQAYPFLFAASQRSTAGCRVRN